MKVGGCPAESSALVLPRPCLTISAKRLLQWIAVVVGSEEVGVLEKLPCDAVPGWDGDNMGAAPSRDGAPDAPEAEACPGLTPEAWASSVADIVRVKGGMVSNEERPTQRETQPRGGNTAD